MGGMLDARRRGKGVAWSLGLIGVAVWGLCASARAQATGAATAAAPATPVAEFSVPERVVACYPIPLRIVLKSGLLKLPESNPLDNVALLPYEFSWRARATGRDESIQVRPAATRISWQPGADAHAPPVKSVDPVKLQELGARGPSEAVSDLGSLFDRMPNAGQWQDSTGDSDFALDFSASLPGTKNAVVHIHTMERNDTEKTLFNNVCMLSGRYDDPWMALILQRDMALCDVDLAKLSPEAIKQLGLHLLLSELANSPKPIAQLDVPAERIDALLPQHRTMGLLERYEIATAAGRGDAVNELRREILERWPEGDSALASADKGAGLVAELRKQVKPAGKTVVQASMPSTAVIGLPLPLQVILKQGTMLVPDGKGTFAPNRPLTLSPFGQGMALCPVAFDLKRAGADEAIHFEVSPRISSGTARGTMVFQSVSPRRVFAPAQLTVDVSAIPITVASSTTARGGPSTSPSRISLITKGLQPGDYTVTFVDKHVQVEPKELKIQLLAPNPAERKLLDNLNQVEDGIRPKWPNWNSLIERRSEVLAGVGLPLISETGRKQLEPHLNMAEFANARDPIARLQLSDKSVADWLPEYQLYGIMMRCEIEEAAKHDDAAAQLRWQILSRDTDSLPWLKSDMRMVNVWRDAAGRM